jgi:hypothetical protein
MLKSETLKRDNGTAGPQKRRLELRKQKAEIREAEADEEAEMGRRWDSGLRAGALRA